MASHLSQFSTDFTQPQIVLAPMEGLTDPLMRDILTSIGH